MICVFILIGAIILVNGLDFFDRSMIVGFCRYDLCFMAVPLLDIASKGTCKKLSAEQQFFLCRHSADWIELSKKEPITAVQICVLSALRLCVRLFDNRNMKLCYID